MFRTRLVPATMAAIIVLGAASAANASSGEKENAGEISAVLSAKTSISQAIKTAEQKTGGRAMKADLEHEHGNYAYEIKTVTKDKVTNIFVDPASGKITRTDDEGLIAKIFDEEDQSEFRKLAAASVTLGTAVTTAEKNTGGRAVEANFENEDGKTRFEVEVAKDKAMHKVVIDAASGKVIKVLPARKGEHNEG